MGQSIANKAICISLALYRPWNHACESISVADARQ
jgi:hypothetical protein